MRLYLVQHGEALSADDDPARPLSEAGRRDVAALVGGLYSSLHDHATAQIDTHRQRILSLTRSYRFHRPVERLRQTQQRLDEVTARLHRSTRHRLHTERNRLEATERRLALLDPRRPLMQGYVRVERDGEPMRQAALLRHDDKITLHFYDGTRQARIDD